MKDLEEIVEKAVDDFLMEREYRELYGFEVFCGHTGAQIQCRSYNCGL